MKRLNIKLLLILGIGLGVSIVGTHFLHGYQMKRNATNLQSRAAAAREKGDLSEEVRLLQRYVRYREDDIDAFRRMLSACHDDALGVDTFSIEKIGSAFRWTQGAVAKYPDDEEIQRMSSQFFAKLGPERINDTLDSLRALEGMDKLLPEDSIRYAKCEITALENEKGLMRLGELIGFNPLTKQFDSEGTAPKELAAYGMLAQLHRERIDKDDLTVPKLVMEKMLDVNKEQHRAHLMYASWLEQLASLNDVTGQDAIRANLPYIEEALRISPEDAVVLNAAGQYFVRMEEYSRARTYLEKAIEVDADNPTPYIQLAMLEERLQQGSIGKQNALQQLQRGLDRMKLNQALLMEQMLRQLDLRQLADAKRTFNRVSKALKPYDRDYLSARIMMQESKLQDAANLLKRSLATLRPEAYPHSRATRLLLDCYQRLGQTDLVESLSKTKPDSLDSSYSRAVALASSGKYQEALSIFEELWGDDKLTEQGRDMIFKQLFELHVGLQDRLPANRRDWSKVDILVDKYKSRIQGPYLLNLQSLLLVKKGQNQRAIDLTKQAIQRYPKLSIFWTRLISLTTNDQEAMQLLQQMEASIGDGFSIRSAKAGRLAKMNQADAAEKIEELLAGIDSFKPEEQRLLKQQVAAHLSSIDRRDRSIAIWKQIRDEFNVPAARTVLFELAVEEGKVEEVDEALAEIGNFHGQDTANWYLASARRLIWMIQTQKAENSELETVQTFLDKASNKRPDWAPIFDARADAALLANNPAEAVRYLTQAYERNPSNVRYVQKLAQGYLKAGQPDAARRYLDMLPDDQKTGLDQRNQIVLLSRNDPKKAIEKAKELIGEPTEPDDIIFMAGLYTAAKQPDQASAVLRNGIQADASNSNLWLQYVSTLYRNGKADRIEKLFPTMEAKVDPSAMPLLMGQCHAIIGKLDGAKTWYERALKAEPGNTVIMRNLVQLALSKKDSAAANEVLDRMIASQAAGIEAQRNVRWARQQQALLLTESQTISDFEKAIRLVEANRNDRGEFGAADQQLWLTIHANRPEADIRRKALDRLESIRNSRTLTPNESMILAQLYKMSGRWNEAKRIMVSIMTERSSVALIAQYVDWLLENKELNDAASWANKLPPSSPEGLRLHSTILVMQGKSKQAHAKLMALVPKNLPQNEMGKLRDVARMMAVLGQINPAFFKPANGLWRRYLKHDQTALKDYVPFSLSIPGKKALDTAFSQCDKIVKKSVEAKKWDDVMYYASVAIDGLRGHKKDITAASPYYGMVEKWLNAARAGGSDPANVLWKLASLADIKGDVAVVEKHYREYLALPNTGAMQRGVVQNNLAYLLAINNRGQEALKIIDDAMRVLGSQSDLRDTRAMAYIFNNQPNKAIEELQSIIDAGEGTMHIYFHLAFALQRSQRNAEAATALSKAFELGLKIEELPDAERKICQSLSKTLKVAPPTNELSSAR